MDDFYMDKIKTRYKWSIFIKILPVLIIPLIGLCELIPFLGLVLGWILGVLWVLSMFVYILFILIIMTAVFTIQYITALVKHKNSFEKEDIQAVKKLCIVDIGLLFPSFFVYYWIFTVGIYAT